MTQNIVLATTSPRRLKLFELLKLPYLAVSPQYEEENDLPVAPDALVKILAEKKAASVAPQHPDALIIACDTVVSFEHKMLGKPKTNSEAVEMLMRLSGKTHQVISGVCILDVATGTSSSKSIVTTMYSRAFSQKIAQRYVEQEDVLGVAGGYDHEHLGAILIEKIDGDFYNSIGFPVEEVARMLGAHGIGPLVEEV